MTKPEAKSDLLSSWRAAWPGALAAWSSYTMMRDPRFIEDDKEAQKDGMLGQIAAIRLRDHTVMVNAKEIRARGLEDCALPILAHEIGHHVFVPGNATDHGRMIAAMSRMLTGLSKGTVHVVANLYGDLMINDRLQRRAQIDIAKVYAKLRSDPALKAPSNVWRVYMRAYEHLWRAAPGALAPPGITAEMDADALLIARLVRNFSGDWLRGARRFAVVLYPYLADDEERSRSQTLIEAGLHDTQSAGGSSADAGDEDAIPDGLSAIDPSEIDDDDGFDQSLDDPLDDDAPGDRPRREPAKPINQAPTREGKGRPGHQYRSPEEYRRLLESLGLDLGRHEFTTRYYRERALPYLIPFPSRRAPKVMEPLAEGYEEWNAADPLEALDLFGSMMRSPQMIPGVTTVQRVYGETPGTDPGTVPMDLDIYVDCSGSMPHPSIDVSYLALAGAILALSALRAGARVQATLWSGRGQFETTGAFIRDEKRVLGTVTGYIAGGTSFPLHVLRDTYRDRKASEPSAHVVVISDDGADTMLAKDEAGTEGAEIAAIALEKARGGGTLVLNLPETRAWPARETFLRIGYRIHAVQAWEDLVAFAREFVRENYGTTR